MGERGLSAEPATGDEIPTDDDIAAMCDLVDEAIGAGALGFATSRTLLHRVPDGRPVPGTWADERELFAIGDVLGRHQRGVFEVAPRFERHGPNYENVAGEIHWMAEVRRRTGRPVTFGIGQTDFAPGLHTEVFAVRRGRGRRGGDIRPADHAARHRAALRSQLRTFFDRAPGWDALKGKGLDGRLAALDDDGDARRAARVGAGEPGARLADRLRARHRAANYRFTPEDSLAAHAERRGVDPVEAFVDISRETRGAALFSFPFLNQQHDAIEWMLGKDYCTLGLGDSGAHVGLIMDAGQPTWFLSHWVRDTQTMTLEDGVRRLTSETADLFGSPTAGGSCRARSPT